MHRAGPSSFLIVLLLFTVACAGNRDAEVRMAKGDAGSQANASAEALKGALDQFLDRIRNLTTNTAARIQARKPDNNVRRAILMWQLHVQEVCLDTAYRKNLMVALVQTWYWTVSIDRFATVGKGSDLFGPHQADVVAVAHGLAQEGEALAARYIEPKPFAALKADIDSAAGTGELFTASNEARNAAMDKFLSATRLESLFSIVMSPFDFMSGVGKSSDSLADLTRIADRAVVMAERYPQLISLHLQMAAIEMQEQQAPTKAFEDFHRLAATGEQLGQTVRDMPAQLRAEAQKLLEAGGPAQADARVTLDKVKDAGAALEKAATAIDQGIRSLDAFVAHAKAGDGKQDAGKDAAPSHPFDIREFTAAAVAIESLAKELRATIADLERGVSDAGVNGRLTALIDGRLATARTESERLLDKARDDADQLLIRTRAQADALLIKATDDGTALIDHLAKRIAQLLGLATALAVVIVLVVRRSRRAA